MANGEYPLAGDGSMLVAHWPLKENCDDVSGNGHHGKNAGTGLVTFGSATRQTGAAELDGRGARIEVAGQSLLEGGGPFSLSARVRLADSDTDVPGDIISWYDPEARRGFSLGVQTLAGVTCSQSNYRNLYFGVDAGSSPSGWTDCGRPGNAIFASAMAVHDGSLYTGTFEMDEEESGHVYSYEGDGVWADCGVPDPCNAVTALATWKGSLYAGVSHYRSIGSSLEESPNMRPGGRIYRYDGGTDWTDCGKLGGPGTSATTARYTDYLKRFAGWEPDEVDGIHGLAVFDGALYAIPMYHQGLFRYEGGRTWTDCGSPGVRLMSLGVYDGSLYGAGNEGNKHGGVFRYEGEGRWTRTGDQDGVDQVYSFAVYGGDMYVGTWPDAKVFRYDGGETWTACGRLGEELEVMGMGVYNGKLYAGTLPLAEVHRYDGGSTWTRTGQLDKTPDVRIRRAWSMATFQGRLFCGTLPSGRVYALEAGACVTHDDEFPDGWHQVVAVADADGLRLYLDGEPVASSQTSLSDDWRPSADRPLRIGTGPNDALHGSLADVRVYNRALSAEEVQSLQAR